MKPYFLIALILLSCQAKSQKTENKIAVAASHFLESLDKSQIKKATYPFEDSERFNWHFVPRSRNGVPLKEMNETQKKAAYDLLKTTLNEQGYEKAIAIIQMEIILRELEGRGENDPYRDPVNYYFTIFGKPDDKETWGWRIEGHHLALNFSSLTGKIASATPTFWGSNPGIVPNGKEKGKQILKKEVDLAFKLLHSLSEDQKKKAIFAEDAPLMIYLQGISEKPLCSNPRGLFLEKWIKNNRKFYSA